VGPSCPPPRLVSWLRESSGEIWTLRYFPRGREDGLQLMLLHIYARVVWPAGRPQCAMNDRFMPALYFTDALLVM
jgi:hypothetical protein